MSKRVLILGINGQTGSYLAEHLLREGCEVHGLYRRSSVDNLVRVRHLLERITLHKGDLCDPQSIDRVLWHSTPSAIFNMADQDNVDWSLATPAYSMDVTAGAVLRLLESVRHFNALIRVFQPVSAMMFGDSPPPQDESSPINPLSPYAVCKTAAYHACRMYRQVHGMHVSCGILFNHTSLRRQGSYLLHHVCREAVAVAEGRQDVVVVGDPDMRVDIGHAREYAEAIWKILNYPTPEDFVIGTGCGWSVREMCEEALRVAGVTGDVASRVVADPSLLRPGPQPVLIADAAKARHRLGWSAKVGVDAIVREFVAAAKEKRL